MAEWFALFMLVTHILIILMGIVLIIMLRRFHAQEERHWKAGR